MCFTIVFDRADRHWVGCRRKRSLGCIENLWIHADIYLDIEMTLCCVSVLLAHPMRHAGGREWLLIRPPIEKSAHAK